MAGIHIFADQLKSSGDYSSIYFDNYSVGLSQSNDTRWNSMFRHLQAIAKLQQAKLSSALDAATSVNCNMTPKEHSQLLELISILKPFYEITLAIFGV